MTRINIDGKILDFVNDDVKVVVERCPEKKDHAGVYELQIFHRVRSGWAQGSKAYMAASAFDYHYNWLTTPVMGQEVLLDSKHVSLEAFTALCKALV
jgi:hypothetical protein